jgi:hypothetical protein
MPRDADTAESRAARPRRGLPSRCEPPPSRAGAAAAGRAAARPVPPGHPGPICPSDGAGGVAAGLARIEPRVSLAAAPRSLLGAGSPAEAGGCAERARDGPGPAGWWPLAGPARVRARLAGWSPPRVAAGWPGARSACASPAGRRPRDETPAPRGSSAQRGRIEGFVTEPPLGGCALPINGDGGAARGGPGITVHLPDTGGAAALGARAPASGFLRSGPRFFGRRPRALVPGAERPGFLVPPPPRDQPSSCDHPPRCCLPMAAALVHAGHTGLAATRRPAPARLRGRSGVCFEVSPARRRSFRSPLHTDCSTLTPGRQAVGLDHQK